MNTDITYELKILFPECQQQSAKGQVVDFLKRVGEHSFVEGAIDDVRHDYDYENPDFDPFALDEELPISVFKYDAEYLKKLKDALESEFGDKVEVKESTINSRDWIDGWKQGFVPVETERFYVYPPWKKCEDVHKIPIEIEPGMAFGTGQHETTQLCLRTMEAVLNPTQHESLLDVGAGTGILAIAASKIGIGHVVATDIDHDAVHACKINAFENDSKIQVRPGSIAPGTYDVVIANILVNVLEPMYPALAQAVNPDGLLILSGLLIDQAELFKDRAEELGLVLVSESHLKDWAVLVMRKAQ